MTTRYPMLMRLVVAVFSGFLFSGIAAAQSNLTPYQPTGWSDKIVVSTGAGTNTDSASLTSTNNLYVDWAVANNGSAATGVRFFTDLYVDNVLRASWYSDPPLNAGFYTNAQDYSLGTLSAGTHTLRIVTDSSNVIAESNEADNQYTKTITVTAAGSPNLTPYQPSGWSDKVVVSTGTGANTDSSTLAPTDTLYLDWAVINNGSVATGVRFYSELYVDNVLRTSWYTDPPLNAGFYSSALDYSLGTLSAGSHTLRIVTDSTGAIAETSEADNQYTKTIVVGGTATPTLTSIGTGPVVPIRAQQFTFTIAGSGFDPSTEEVFFLGPGCGAVTTCVVPNSVLTTKTATTAAGPATLTDGSFTVQVRNTSNGAVSNAKPFYVAAQAGTSASRALVLLVDFPDKPGQVSREFFQNLLFGNHPSEAPQGSFRDYYKEVSYGGVDVEGSVNNAAIAWIRLPQNSTYYTNSCFGISTSAAPACNATYPQNAQRMIEDAVVAARNLGLDFAPFDANNDGLVDALFVIHAGQGAEYTNNRNDIWSHAWSTASPVNTGSTNAASQPIYVSHYTTEPEYNNAPGDITIGVFAHEFGHTRWGLPDLYDIDYTSAGIGKWSLMSYGANNGSPQGSSPAHLDAWSKAFVGFATPAQVTSTLTNEIITQAETTADIYQLLNGSATGHSGEYFLIENRQQTGFDAGLPSSGLLIWHIDENRGYPEDGAENYPGCSGCSGHYKVQLVQADNRWDLEKNSNKGDSGDPFPGVCGGACNTSFTGTTLPNSKLWNGQSTGVTITNISSSSAAMTATLSPSSVSVPSLTMTKTHSGSFTQGQSNAQYTLIVSNGAGAAATSGTVTVTEATPSGLTLISMFGTGWTCNANTCTRSDALSAGASYPAITATVNVLANATSPQINAAAVSGGGAANASVTDSTTVIPLPADLTITKVHSGNFIQGQSGRTYTITVSNNGAGNTIGAVSVVETMPAGLSATSISGTGWTCTQPAGPCTRSDVLAASTAYPAITLTVNVAANAAASITNSVTVSGGGETNTSNDTATDPTIVAATADFTLSGLPSSQGVMQGTGTSFTVTVAALNGFNGAVGLTVSGLPAGATALFNPISISGAGQSTLAVTTLVSTPTGSYPLNIVGTNGTLAHNATVTLVVQPLAVSLSNVALASNGAVAVASSSYSTAFAPSGANNGDRKGLSWGGGGGWNDATDNAFPDWLEIDFNGNKSIQEIDVFTMQDNYASPIEPAPSTTFALYGLTDFQVQYWAGSQWLTVTGGNVSGNNLVWRQFLFSPVSTTAVRVLVNGALNRYSRIIEVEAYGIGASGNAAPTVQLNAPSNNAGFTAPATVFLNATANDGDGGISKVEFYAGTTLIATSASGANPYAATWNNVPSGSYAITAVATDNLGAITVSAIANINVTGTTPINVAAASNGGVAVASSSYSTAFAPIGANNGDRKGSSWGAGGGWNDGSDNTFPDWLEIDFNSAKTIQEIDVLTMQDNYASPIQPTLSTTFALYGLTDFQVQYWSGSQWLTVTGGNVTGNNRVWRQFLFSPVSTTAVRVLVNGALNRYSRIIEVEAYGIGASGNAAPTVQLNAPSNNAGFTAPATVFLNATANDGDGSISKVEFYAGTTLIYTSASGTNPYTATWNNVPSGSYAITAVATDNLGATTTSAIANITITGTTPINVALASNGAVAVASSIYSSAYPASSTNNGDRKGLSWGAGGGWNDATESTYPDWLEIDFNGNKSIQEIDVFTLQDSYASPIDPTLSTTFSQYGLTDFQVQYWSGSQWLTVTGGTITGNNRVWRQFLFSPVSTTAVRVLVNGALNGYSRITEIEAYGVAASGNAPPTVLLNAPSNNATFTAPATVSLNATANDSDGSIGKVEFYAGTTLIATSASGANPYTATWSNVPSGSYAITAVATDNLGAITMSAIANITVTGTTPVNVALASNGGVAVASSSYSSAYPANSANNGDRKGLSWGSGGGWNDSTESTYPDWLEIDFNGTKTIQEIDVFTVQDSYSSPSEPTSSTTFSLYGLTDFQVQYWNGSQWVTVTGGNVTGNNLVWRKFLFSPVSTTAVRVLVNGALNGYSRITEVEAYTAP